MANVIYENVVALRGCSVLVNVRMDAGVYQCCRAFDEESPALPADKASKISLHWVDAGNV